MKLGGRMGNGSVKNLYTLGMDRRPERHKHVWAEIFHSRVFFISNFCSGCIGWIWIRESEWIRGRAEWNWQESQLVSTLNLASIALLLFWFFSLLHFLLFQFRSVLRSTNSLWKRRGSQIIIYVLPRGVSHYYFKRHLVFRKSVKSLRSLLSRGLRRFQRISAGCSVTCTPFMNFNSPFLRIWEILTGRVNTEWNIYGQRLG